MLEGKNILVTGGTGGIGEAIVRKCASIGANVIFTYHSNKDMADELVKSIREDGQQAASEKMNIESFDEVKKVFGKIVKQYEKIDVLVNNSGISRNSSLLMMSNDDWNDVISVNLTGTYNCCKNILRPMMRRKSGKIINVVSVSGLRGTEGQTNYSASKAGIIGFTRSLAKEVARFGIAVNCIAPGFIETNMIKEMPSKTKEKFMEGIPVHRFGQPMEVANLAAFLASDDSNYIIGEVITIDGGLSM